MLGGKEAHTDERKRDAEDREYQKLMGGYLPPGGGMTGNCHFLLLLLAFSEGFLSYNYYTTKVTHLKLEFYCIHGVSLPSPQTNFRISFPSHLQILSPTPLWVTTNLPLFSTDLHFLDNS